MDAGEVSVRCCIAGGGPAGMMLGFLLARAGVSVLVLEKHADFLRDFRGDTIHPSTLEIMHELGLLDELPSRCGFIGLMPQWDFLDFLAEHAKRYPDFQLKMEAEVRDLVQEGGRVTGLRATTPGFWEAASSSRTTSAVLTWAFGPSSQRMSSAASPCFAAHM